MRRSIMIFLAAVLLFAASCSDDDSATGPATQTVTTPQFDPPAGNYSAVQHVKISCSTADASVYYTLDGSEPTESSTACPAGDSIEVAVTTTIKARGYKSGMNPSGIAEATYTIDLPNVDTPFFEPAEGLYAAPQDIIIHCTTADARIFYTTDGSDPDTNSTEFIFQTVIPVSSTITIRARGFKDDMDPSAVASATYTIIPDLVAYYPFNGNADDWSGNSHDGTVHGAALTNDRFGRQNAAFQFDGTDDYIELPDESAFDFTAFTISFWVRIATLPTPPGPYTPGYYCVINKGSFNLGNYTIRLSKTGGASYCNLSYAHCTSTGNWSTGCWENINLNRYYHIAITMSDQIRSYIDGALECTSSSMTPAVLDNDRVLIGKLRSATDPYYFEGIIDDVRFYDRALSDTEVADLYEAEN